MIETSSEEVRSHPSGAPSAREGGPRPPATGNARAFGRYSSADTGWKDARQHSRELRRRPLPRQPAFRAEIGRALQFVAQGGKIIVAEQDQNVLEPADDEIAQLEVAEDVGLFQIIIVRGRYANRLTKGGRNGPQAEEGFSVIKSLLDWVCGPKRGHSPRKKSG